MEKLREHLDGLINELNSEQREQVKQQLSVLAPIYPFNEFELCISMLMEFDKLSLEGYFKLRDEYVLRNPNLHIFEISAPRTFGEAWAEGHLMSVAPELVKPTKKLDQNYSGQYDFILDGDIHVEVKASRAVDFHSEKALCLKALLAKSDKHFVMNFQQVKPGCCDVVVWVGVWRDIIRYWVLSSDEVSENRFYSDRQHRGNTGEGQLHLKNDNISQFSNFESTAQGLAKSIREAYKRQKN